MYVSCGVIVGLINKQTNEQHKETEYIMLLLSLASHTGVCEQKYNSEEKCHAGENKLSAVFRYSVCFKGIH